MAQNQDPFSLQFGPMIPAGPVTSQPDEVAPPLPPRPKRRPVHAAGAATSQLPPDPGPPTSITQSPQLGELGTSPTNPLPSLTTPNFNGPAAGYGSIPPAMSAQVAASPGSPESKPKKRHSFFSSGVRQFAKVTFLESITPGLSAALAFDNPAMPDPHQSSPFPESQLSQVVVNGVKLGQADLLALQAVVGPLLPGSYWYDRVSGAYGMTGGPCSGFISANLPLGGGQLASDASGHTGTGVFINDREIHTIDIVGLQRMGAVVMPGRWWLNADGSYGAEGSFVVLGNLRLQANAANNAGGAHSWSTSMGHYGGSDGQGFSYVGGPGWSYSSG